MLDDRDQLDSGVRAILHNTTVKTRADARYTANIFNLTMGTDVDPAAVIEELARYRLGDKDYVIEGVETEEQYDYLQAYWPDEYAATGIQGYAIRVASNLEPLFEPMHVPEQPGGYRLREEIASLTHTQ